VMPGAHPIAALWRHGACPVRFFRRAQARRRSVQEIDLGGFTTDPPYASTRTWAVVQDRAPIPRSSHLHQLRVVTRPGRRRSHGWIGQRRSSPGKLPEPPRRHRQAMSRPEAPLRASGKMPAEPADTPTTLRASRCYFNRSRTTLRSRAMRLCNFTNASPFRLAALVRVRAVRRSRCLGLACVQVRRLRTRRAAPRSRRCAGAHQVRVRSASAPAAVVGWSELVELHLAAGRPDPFALVFADSAGGYHRRQNWRRRVWISALERAGVAYFRPYDLRHTCATLLLYEGRTVNEVAEHLGRCGPGLHRADVRARHARRLEAAARLDHSGT